MTAHRITDALSRLTAGGLSGRLMLIYANRFNMFCRIHHHHAWPEMPGSCLQVGSFRLITKPDGIERHIRTKRVPQLSPRRARMHSFGA